MSMDKLVDSTQLNADLASVASAIRTKGGTSSQLAFPTGFVTAIGNIQTGYSFADIATGAQPSGELELTGALVLRSYAFAYCPNITKVHIDLTADQSHADAFYNCTGIQSGYIRIRGDTTNAFNSIYSGCTGMVTSVVIIDGVANARSLNYQCTNLEVADYTVSYIGMNMFYGNAKLSTVILRSTTVVPLYAVSSLASNTPFKSGGAGGTIYIPKSLYDHLGDGTSSDYRAATNWSTIYGYGTITWAKIEGSQYENYYADGTPVPT